MFSRFYYAMEHTIIPMLTGIAMSLLSLPIFYYLPKQMGESGLSATISIVKVVYFITLVTFFIPFYRKRSNDGYKFFDGKKIFLEIFKIVLFFSIITSIFVVIKSKIDFNWILTLFVGSFIQLFISLILLKYSKIDGYKKFSDRYLSKISRRVKIFKIFTV